MLFFLQHINIMVVKKVLSVWGMEKKALRLNEQTKIMEETTCPCESLKSEDNPKGECVQRAHLLCLIPKVSMGGTYQITLSSINSIIDINSGFDYVSAMIGRFALVPLKLRRIPTETHHNKQKQIHYTLQLLLDVPIDMVQALRADTSRILTHTENQYALEAPKDENPAMDEEAVIEYIDEENGQQEEVASIPLIEESIKEETQPQPIPEPAYEAQKVVTEPTKEKTDMNKFLPLIAKELIRLGKDKFFQILGSYGLTKPEEATDKDIAAKLYKELLATKLEVNP